MNGATRERTSQVSRGDTSRRGREGWIINLTWTSSGECNIKKYKYKVQSKCTKKRRVETPARRKEAMEGAQVCYSGTKAIPAMTVDKTRLIFPVFYSFFLRSVHWIILFFYFFLFSFFLFCFFPFFLYYFHLYAGHSNFTFLVLYLYTIPLSSNCHFPNSPTCEHERRSHIRGH
jgi:hypothetical protein